MEGFSSTWNDTFTSTRGCAEPMFFPQHILPLLPLYNAQWWGYESLTAIVLVWYILLSSEILKIVNVLKLLNDQYFRLFPLRALISYQMIVSVTK